MINNPLTTILIVTRNRLNDLIVCIKSAINQTYPNKEIIVFDNASSDGTFDFIVNNYKEIKIIRAEENYGCVKGRNEGIKFARGEYIFFIDDDAVLHTKSLEYAIETISKEERIGIVGGIVIPVQKLEDANLTLNLEEAEIKIKARFHGGICLQRKNMYPKTGLYPDEYYYGAEEAYLTLNMLRNNYFVAEDPRVILFHLKSGDNRDSVTELLLRQTNSLANRIRLLPAELSIAYVLTTLVKNPVRAIREKILFRWLKKWPKMWFNIIRTNLKYRQPVTRDIFRKYFIVNNFEINTITDLHQNNYPYWKCLFREIIRPS